MSGIDSSSRAVNARARSSREDGHRTDHDRRRAGAGTTRRRGCPGRAPRGPSPGTHRAGCVVLTDHRGLRERPPRVALARRDPRAHVALVAAADGDDAILAGAGSRRISVGDIDLEDIGDRADDRLVGRRGIEAGVDGAAEVGRAGRTARPDPGGPAAHGRAPTRRPRGRRRPSSCRGRRHPGWASSPLSTLSTPSIDPVDRERDADLAGTSALAARSRDRWRCRGRAPACRCA